MTNEVTTLYKAPHDPTCGGWPIREHGKREGFQIATFRDEAEADAYVEMRNSSDEPAEPMLLGEAMKLLEDAGYPASDDWRQRYRQLRQLYEHLQSLPVEPT